MNPEAFASHNQVKNAINEVVGRLVRKLDLGKYCPDGLWITHDARNLSTEAIATFLSWERLGSGEAHLVPNAAETDGIEMRGSPDWAAEILSYSSERKDATQLLDLYFRAQVREYWLVDARGDAVSFTA